MKSGIYTIENITNSKLYVGLSTDVCWRLRQHRIELKAGIHRNYYLQNAWNKYGEKSFRFELLVEIEEEYLYSEEHYWCTLLQVHDRRYGYNRQATNPNGKSVKVSEETRRKIGATNRKIRELHPYKVTDEVKKIISRSSIERWKGEEYRNAVVNGVREKLSKKVYKYNANGLLVKEFNSISEADRQGEGNISSISIACNVIPHRYKVKGYYWSFSKVNKLEVVDHPKKKISKIKKL